MKKESKSLKETCEIVKIFFAEILKKGKKREGALVVGLSGELGAGKTAFTQFVGKLLGIPNRINSPTFVIMKKYSIKKLKDYKFLLHIDAYRLKNEKELIHLGWNEMINNREFLIFIEWPENIKKAMPKSSTYINISHIKAGHRKLELK